MNKIIVKENKIVVHDNVLVDGNIINLTISGIYEIEYQKCNNINLEFNINNCDVELLDNMFDNTIVINNTYNINNGSLRINKFYSNKHVSSAITINLLGIGDRFYYNFSSICSGIENYIINVNHKNEKTISIIKNKSVSIKNGEINFIINSSVLKHCIKSVIDQNTRIITLDNSRAKVSPNMFVDLDDVVAKHGSVIGTFKKEQVFYLMSKGIDYYNSIKLLVKGYLLSNVSISLPTRIKVMNKINEYWR